MRVPSVSRPAQGAYHLPRESRPSMSNRSTAGHFTGDALPASQSRRKGPDGEAAISPMYYVARHTRDRERTQVAVAVAPSILTSNHAVTGSKVVRSAAVVSTTHQSNHVDGSWIRFFLSLGEERPDRSLSYCLLRPAADVQSEDRFKSARSRREDRFKLHPVAINVHMEVTCLLLLGFIGFF